MAMLMRFSDDGTSRRSSMHWNPPHLAPDEVAQRNARRMTMANSNHDGSGRPAARILPVRRHASGWVAQVAA